MVIVTRPANPTTITIMPGLLARHRSRSSSSSKRRRTSKNDDDSDDDGSACTTDPLDDSSTRHRCRQMELLLASGKPDATATSNATATAAVTPPSSPPTETCGLRDSAASTVPSTVCADESPAACRSILFDKTPPPPPPPSKSSPPPSPPSAGKRPLLKTALVRPKESSSQNGPHRVADAATDATATTTAKKKSVRFSTLEIRTYPITLGDNPSVSSGPPLTLDWNYTTVHTVAVSAYETERPPSSRRRPSQMVMPTSLRIELLTEDAHVGIRTIAEVCREVERCKRERRRTADAALGGPGAWLCRAVRRMVPHPRGRC